MEPEKDLASVPVPKLVAVPMAVALAALAWFAFAPVLENGFVDIDDYVNIRDDHDFRGLGWKQVVAAFTTPRIGVYQPLGSLLLSAEYLACGLDPRGYHATSLVVHALNAVVLFGLVLTVLGRWNPVALREHPRTFTIATGLAVAWFAAHPARAEPVAWVTAQLYLPVPSSRCSPCWPTSAPILPAGPRVAASGWPARTHWPSSRCSSCRGPCACRSSSSSLMPRCSTGSISGPIPPGGSGVPLASWPRSCRFWGWRSP